MTIKVGEKYTIDYGGEVMLVKVTRLFKTVSGWRVAFAYGEGLDRSWWARKFFNLYVSEGSKSFDYFCECVNPPEETATELTCTASNN